MSALLSRSCLVTTWRGSATGSRRGRHYTVAWRRLLKSNRGLRIGRPKATVRVRNLLQPYVIPSLTEAAQPFPLLDVCTESGVAAGDVECSATVHSPQAVLATAEIELVPKLIGTAMVGPLNDIGSVLRTPTDDFEGFAALYVLDPIPALEYFVEDKKRCAAPP